MRFRSIVRGTAAAFLAGIVAAGCVNPDPTPSSDPALEPVTHETLYEREQYWPDQVRLTEPWRPDGFQGEQFGYGLGILVRVEPSGELRVDFARLGQHRVPARVTDVIERANAIRLGEIHKPRPKFVFAVANKLLIPTSDPLRYVNPEGVGHIDAYLLVAADPFSEDFSEIASALEPLRARKDLMLALFPQGEQSSNKAIVERCKQVGWTDPFLVVRYAPGFTASYFDDDLEPPSLLLQSPEGRVIHASRWVEDAPAMLARRIDEELGQAPTRATPAVRAGGRLEDPLS